VQPNEDNQEVGLTSTFGRARTKLGAGVLAAVLGFSGAAALVPTAASATANVTTTRYAGVDRYDTAAKAAVAAFPNGTNNIIVASGENFPDGLAASYLSGAVGGAVLLTAKDSLPAVTSNAIGTLDAGAAGTATVYIVGGTSAVSQTVRDQLKALGYTLNEISGTDRYDTAAKAATVGAGVGGVGTFNALPTAVIATGAAFPDALAGGALAQGQKLPLLLVNTAVPSQTDAALTSLGIKQAIVLGGTAAVPDAVTTAITAKGIVVNRIAGANRFDTAAKLGTLETNTAFNGGFGWDGAEVVLANGMNFPDALSSSQIGGTKQAPLLLTASLPAETQAFLNAHQSTITTIYGMGGTSAISDADLTAAKTAATQTAPTATITAREASSTVTVVFSADVTVATAQNTANYIRNNTTPAIGATYNPGTKTATVTFGSNLVAGDVITVNPNQASATAVQTSAGVKVATASVTVTADVTKPAATIKAFSNTTTAYVIFDEAVTTNTAVTLTSTDGRATNQLTPVAGTQVANTVWTGTWGVAPAAGQTANLAAGGFVDSAAAANTNAAASALVVNDTTKPTLSTAKYSATPSVQAVYDLDGGTGPGDLTLTAVATGGAAGVAGNGYSVATASNPTLAVNVNTSTKVITVGAPDLTSVDANALAAAINANATLAGLFTPAVATGGALNLTGLPGTFTVTTPGSSSVVVTLMFSEPLSSTTLASTAITDTAGNPVAGGTVVPTNRFSGVIVVTYTATTGTLLPASITVPAGQATDLAAQTNLAQTMAVTAG
jgi:putative cell wall-binding protein